MPSNPTISVIIPTLNEEKLLSKSLSQFTPDIKKKFAAELIVSDGGSRDATVEISKAFADKIVVTDDREKETISAGRNRGARAADGKYFFFLNADTRLTDADWFFERTLEELNLENTAALTCNIRVFPEEEKLSDKLFHVFYNFYVSLLNRLHMGMGRGECHIIKREYFEKSGGYNEAMPAGEDYDLYRRIGKLGRIKFLRDITVYESPRRYRKYGYVKVFWDWTKNSVSALFRNKAVSEKWEEVR
jgi:glycosyltransferase involved in cell wall biosynthesis